MSPPEALSGTAPGTVPRPGLPDPSSEAVTLPTVHHSGSKGVLTPSPVPVVSIKSHNPQNPFSLLREQGAASRV